MSMLRFCLTFTIFNLNDLDLQNFGVTCSASRKEPFKTRILKIGLFVFELMSMLRFCLTFTIFNLNDLDLQNFGVTCSASRKEQFKRRIMKIG